MEIFVSRILYPVQVLGPGNRIGIWLAGCNHKCSGCSNPELWEKRPEWKMDLRVFCDLLGNLISCKNVDGITITGGDPFDQPEALRDLLKYLSIYIDDVLVYTGYDYVEIKEKYKDILEDIAVLIDGKYVESLNYGQRLKGSENQNIIYLKSMYKQLYENFIVGTHADIQNFSLGNSVVSVGIHKPDYNERIKIKAKEKGLIDFE